MTPAETLGAAADKLEREADAASNATRGTIKLPSYVPLDVQQWIVTMRPAVGRAVAAMLRKAYADWKFREHSLGAMSVRAMSGQTNEPDPDAVAVARAVLGEET